MPAWLIRYLPHIVVALAIIAAVVWIDQRGYERAQADQAAQERRVTAAITKAVDDIDAKTAARLASIDTTQRTIVQPTITREIASDPRFSDPAAGITPDMLRAINRARAASGSASASEGAVPTARTGE